MVLDERDPGRSQEDAITEPQLVLEIYKNYDQRREKINDRRAARNTFYMVFLTSLLAAILIAPDRVPAASLLLGSIVGAVLCGVWYWNLSVISQRILIIYRGLCELEQKLPAKPYSTELERLNAVSRRGVVKIIAIEKLSPLALGLAFAGSVIISLIS